MTTDNATLRALAPRAATLATVEAYAALRDGFAPLTPAAVAETSAAFLAAGFAAVNGAPTLAYLPENAPMTAADLSAVAALIASAILADAAEVR